jgi:hypothetical protein
VSTDDQTLRIGQVLLRLGLITDEHIEQALALQAVAPDPERIGEVLVDVGYISATDISHAMTVQIRTALNVMLDDDDRYFEFLPRDCDTTSAPLNDITLDPLVSTVSDLTRSWLARFEQDTGVDDCLLSSDDVEAISQLSAAQQKLVRQLLKSHHRLTSLIEERNRHAHRVQRSIERLLKHVLMQIARANSASHGQARNMNVLLVDEHIDSWKLTDLTRSARQVLLAVMNGESRLDALQEEIRSSTSSPERAIQELTSTGLIRLESLRKQTSADADPGLALIQRLLASDR